MPKLQSPIIGNALRASLGLDGAGGMPMEADTTIVPVVIVADVRELITDRYIPVQQGANRTAVAAEYSYACLEWQANARPAPKRLLLDSIRYSTSAISSVYVGFFPGGLAGSQEGLARRKVGSLQNSAVAGRVVSGTNLNDPSLMMNIAGNAASDANDVKEIVFQEPIILDQENQFFGIGLSTANITLRAHFQWREERP